MAVSGFSMTSLRNKIDCGVIYLCGNCQLPIGDTNDWSDTPSETVMLLKAVSPFVKIGKVRKSTDPHDAGSRYKPLSCSKCYHVLGKFYSSTPEHLNYKRNLYNIDSTAIDSYKFGANLQRFVSRTGEPVTLETCWYYEEEFKKGGDKCLIAGGPNAGTPAILRLCALVAPQNEVQKVLLDLLYERLSKLEESVDSGEIH